MVMLAYTLEFEQIDAYTQMGLSHEQYDALPGTPEWIDPDHPSLCKCDVLVWYRNKRALERLWK